MYVCACSVEEYKHKIYPTLFTFSISNMQQMLLFYFRKGSVSFYLPRSSCYIFEVPETHPQC